MYLTFGSNMYLAYTIAAAGTYSPVAFAVHFYLALIELINCFLFLSILQGSIDYGNIELILPAPAYLSSRSAQLHCTGDIK